MSANWISAFVANGIRYSRSRDDTYLRSTRQVDPRQKSDRNRAESDIYTRPVTLTGVRWIEMDHPPGSIYDRRTSPDAIDLHATSGTLPNTTPVTIPGLLVCELALACSGLLRHNSMATWRQLPDGWWCRGGRRNLPSYLLPAVCDRTPSQARQN